MKPHDIRADGVELMSTRRNFSEDRLAEVACAPLRDVPHARVLIEAMYVDQITRGNFSS